MAQSTEQRERIHVNQNKECHLDNIFKNYMQRNLVSTNAQGLGGGGGSCKHFMCSCSTFILACRPEKMIIMHHTTIICFLQTSLSLFHLNISVCPSVSSTSLSVSVSLLCGCAHMCLTVKYFLFPHV